MTIFTRTAAGFAEIRTDVGRCAMIHTTERNEGSKNA